MSRRTGGIAPFDACAPSRRIEISGAIARLSDARTRRHVGLLNAWNIKLSDVDTINYALSLTLTIALQLFAIVAITRQGMEEGTVLLVVLYVFEFSATAPCLPESWQEYLRLREILRRLRNARAIVSDT